MSPARAITVMLSLFCAASASAHAQVVRLDRPDATLEEPFSFVRGVRELSNGRLLVADWIENRVVIADFATQGVRQVMREGPGPQEVRLPTAIHRLRGDSSLLVDEGNNRLHLLGPDGRSVRSFVTDVPGRGGVRGMDAAGAYLHAIPSWAEGPNALPDDSVRIVRWVPGAAGDGRVLAVVQGTRYRKDRSPAMQPRMPMVGFAPQDAWVVTPSGALVIVRATPYRLEVHAPGRAPGGAPGVAPVLGPPIPVTTRPVTPDDKKRFMREFAASSPVSGRGPDGGMGRGPQVPEAEIVRMVGTAEWADRYPPFDASSVIAAADGRIWVGAPAIPREPVRYDVFDGAGRRVLQVELRAGRRVAHVGTRGVYVVASDDDGVQTMERYRLP